MLPPQRKRNHRGNSHFPLRHRPSQDFCRGEGEQNSLPDSADNCLPRYPAAARHPRRRRITPAGAAGGMRQITDFPVLIPVASCAACATLTGAFPGGMHEKVVIG